MISHERIEEITKKKNLDFLEWEVGPFHSLLPGPLKIKSLLDGEMISSIQIERGFAYKGLEDLLETRNWRTLNPLVGRIDIENSNFCELAFSLAVEKLLKTEVPERAQNIRRIVCELNRMSSHLKYFVQVAQSVNSETVVHYMLRDREQITDLFELLTGARYAQNLIRIGGVSIDVTEGFLDRVLAVCELIEVRLREYNDIFSFNYTFLKRSCGIGIITESESNRYGMTGPNARASGCSIDMRKRFPYIEYDKVDFTIPLGRGEFGDLGDCHDRFLVRLREITESIEIIRQSCQKIQLGDHINGPEMTKDLIIPEGESFAVVESPRGEFGCYIRSDGRKLPKRVQFKTPSMDHTQILESVLINQQIEDLPLILASLDLGISELDR